jgi:hypothetical protein
MLDEVRSGDGQVTVRSGSSQGQVRFKSRLGHCSVTVRSRSVHGQVR